MAVGIGGGVVGTGETALLQLGSGLEGLDATLLALDLRVGAGEQQGDVRTDVVAEGGLCRGEGGLGDELVVLRPW